MICYNQCVCNVQYRIITGHLFCCAFIPNAQTDNSHVNGLLNGLTVQTKLLLLMFRQYIGTIHMELLTCLSDCSMALACGI